MAQVRQSLQEKPVKDLVKLRTSQQNQNVQHRLQDALLFRHVPMLSAGSAALFSAVGSGTWERRSAMRGA